MGLSTDYTAISKQEKIELHLGLLVILLLSYSFSFPNDN